MIGGVREGGLDDDGGLRLRILLLLLAFEDERVRFGIGANVGTVDALVATELAPTWNCCG